MRTRPAFLGLGLCLVVVLTGCSAEDPEPTATVTVTTTAEPVAADVPDECAEAFTAVEALVAEATDVADAWDEWTAGPLADWLAARAPLDATAEMSDALKAVRADKQTFVDHVAASDYATLRDACLAG